MAIAIGGNTITKNPNYPLDWYYTRFGQRLIETADGGHNVYDSGPSIIYGLLVIRHVDKTEGDALRTYLEGTAVFQKNSFTVAPPPSTNLGKGDGTSIQVFYNGGNDLSGVFILNPPGTYDIRLPYREDTDGIP